MSQERCPVCKGRGYTAFLWVFRRRRCKSCKGTGVMIAWIIPTRQD